MMQNIRAVWRLRFGRTDVGVFPDIRECLQAAAVRCPEPILISDAEEETAQAESQAETQRPEVKTNADQQTQQ